MRVLIQLERTSSDQRDKICYVNPDHVVSIHQGSAAVRSIVNMTGGRSYEVFGSPDAVADKLNVMCEVMIHQI